MLSKQIGILGLGSRSTLYYIKQLNQLYNHQFGGFSTCPFKLLNIDFNTINPLLPEPSNQLFDEIQKALLAILKLDIDVLLVPNITLHETIDQVLKNLDDKITLIHPVDVTIEQLKKDNCSEVMILGSKYTMQSNYIADKLKQNGIQTKIPTTEEIVKIDSLRKALYQEKEIAEEVKAFKNIVKHYAADHALVIACTELSIVDNSPTSKVYDMANLSIEKIADYMIKK